MLEIVWKYLAFKIGSVTVVGMSGEWDPLMIAFLGDLLSERGIPLLVIDKSPLKSNSGGKENGKDEYIYIIRELVIPGIHLSVALEMDADSFMDELTDTIGKFGDSVTSSSEIFILQPRTLTDGYWDSDKMRKEAMSFISMINPEISSLENRLDSIMGDASKSYRLHKFAQLGLKSHWLGIKGQDGKDHNRLNHSIGVMKIASYLYDKATKNSGLKEKQNEKQFLRIAALLHDIGHLPFSHLIEEVFKDLNWKPAQYKGSFSHALHTEKKIQDILLDVPELKSWIEDTDYSIPDLIRLINGNFGVPYLDAIINSPIYADKIDYVFRDTDSTGRKITLSPIQFLKDIAHSLTITPEGFLAFSGRTARAASELLLARRFLYQNLYYQPGIRVLEGIAKQILMTYFVHSLRFDNEIKELSPDLGHYKIQLCIKLIEDMLEKEDVYKSNRVEFKILEMMISELEKFPLNNNLKDSLKLGLEKIEGIDSEDKLKELESKIKTFYYNGEFVKHHEKMVKTARNCMLRMPGTILIDVVKTRRFLSVADERKKKKRNDGTETFSEVILVPPGKHERWYSKQEAKKPLLSSTLTEEDKIEESIVYLYSIWDEVEGRQSDIAHAENLFRQLREIEDIPMEAD